MKGSALCRREPARLVGAAIKNPAVLAGCFVVVLAEGTHMLRLGDHRLDLAGAKAGYRSRHEAPILQRHEAFATVDHGLGDRGSDQGVAPAEGGTNLAWRSRRVHAIRLPNTYFREDQGSVLES